jgi:hypothetical protein
MRWLVSHAGLSIEPYAALANHWLTWPGLSEDILAACFLERRWVLEWLEPLSDDRLSTCAEPNSRDLPCAFDRSTIPVPSYAITATRCSDQGYPLTSIVVVTTGAAPELRCCLDCITHATLAPYELIVVGMRPYDDLTGILEMMTGDVSFIRIHGVQSWAAAVNRAIAKSHGEQIALLTSDTCLPSLWLERSLHALYSAPMVGVVSPCNHAENTWINRHMFEQRARERRRQFAGQTIEFSVLNSPCFLMRRQVVDKIGCLHEDCDVGSYETIDYCLRTRTAGFQCLVALDVLIQCRPFMDSVAERSTND